MGVVGFDARGAGSGGLIGSGCSARCSLLSRWWWGCVRGGVGGAVEALDKCEKVESCCDDALIVVSIRVTEGLPTGVGGTDSGFWTSDDDVLDAALQLLPRTLLAIVRADSGLNMPIMSCSVTRAKGDADAAQAHAAS